MADTVGSKRQGNLYSTSRKETFRCYKEKYRMETRPSPKFSAFLPALLNPQIKPLLQHAFYLSSTTLCTKENLYSVSTHFWHSYAVNPQSTVPTGDVWDGEQMTVASLLQAALAFLRWGLQSKTLDNHSKVLPVLSSCREQAEKCV